MILTPPPPPPSTPLTPVPPPSFLEFLTESPLRFEFQVKPAIAHLPTAYVIRVLNHQHGFLFFEKHPEAKESTYLHHPVQVQSDNPWDACALLYREILGAALITLPGTSYVPFPTRYHVPKELTFDVSKEWAHEQFKVPMDSDYVTTTALIKRRTHP